VDNDGNVINEYHPNIVANIFGLLVAGESIPLQASLIRSTTFFKTSTFDPVLIGVEDRDLGRRVALISEIAFTPEVVARIRIGEVGSTTNWSRLAEDDRRGREKALNMEGAYLRIRTSLKSSYWHGRVCRAYFGSSLWDLRHIKIFTMINRLITGLVFAGWFIFTRNFWQGFTARI
jgi:hypothetical protein